MELVVVVVGLLVLCSPSCQWLSDTDEGNSKVGSPTGSMFSKLKGMFTKSDNKVSGDAVSPGETPAEVPYFDSLDNDGEPFAVSTDDEMKFQSSEGLMHHERDLPARSSNLGGNSEADLVDSDSSDSDDLADTDSSDSDDLADSDSSDFINYLADIDSSDSDEDNLADADSSDSDDLADKDFNDADEDNLADIDSSDSDVLADDSSDSDVLADDSSDSDVLADDSSDSDEDTGADADSSDSDVLADADSSDSDEDNLDDADTSDSEDNLADADTSDSEDNLADADTNDSDEDNLADADTSDSGEGNLADADSSDSDVLADTDSSDSDVLADTDSSDSDVLADTDSSDSDVLADVDSSDSDEDNLADADSSDSDEEEDLTGVDAFDLDKYDFADNSASDEGQFADRDSGDSDMYVDSISDMYAYESDNNNKAVESNKGEEISGKASPSEDAGELVVQSLGLSSGDNDDASNVHPSGTIAGDAEVESPSADFTDLKDAETKDSLSDNIKTQTNTRLFNDKGETLRVSGAQSKDDYVHSFIGEDDYDF